MHGFSSSRVDRSDHPRYTLNTFILFSFFMFAGKCSPQQCKDWALLGLRVALAIVFILHGWGKLFGDTPGMTAFIGMVGGLGFPATTLFAYLAALSEFLGGIAMLLGVFTNVFSVLLSIVMMVALFGVKRFSFPLADIDLALLAMAIAVGLMGPGRYSMMGWFKKDQAGCEHCGSKK